jgi:hypothetical protein
VLWEAEDVVQGETKEGACPPDRAKETKRYKKDREKRDKVVIKKLV